MADQNEPSIVLSEWATTEETMEALGIAQRTLQTWAKNGQLKWKMLPVPGLRPVRVYKTADIEKLREGGPPHKRNPILRGGQQVAEPGKPAERTRKLPTEEAKSIKEVLDALKIYFQQQKQLVSTLELTTQNHPAQFLTLAESAAALRLPKAHIHRAVKDGRLRAIKSGGWRIRRSHLYEFQG